MRRAPRDRRPPSRPRQPAKLSSRTGMQSRRIAILIGFTGFCAGAVSAPTVIQQGDIIAHLARTISWYRNVENAADLSGGAADVLMREGAHQAALKGLQLAFDFARA